MTAPRSRRSSRTVGQVNPPDQPDPPTIVEVFRRQVDQYPDRVALRVHGPSGFEPISWGEYGRRVDRMAARLQADGVVTGDRVAILSSNRPEWHITDLAALSLGAVTVPVYTTSSPDQIRHVLGHSGARVCVIEARLEPNLRPLRHDLPDLEHLLPIESAGRNTEPGPAAPDRTLVEIGPQTLATLVYTSGTTGLPKGVMLTHGNLSSTVAAVTAVVPVGPDDRFLSFLPLSHIAERIVSHFGHIVSGGETWFARDLASLADDLPACRPTIFFAVPRVWEKAQAAVENRVASLPRPVRLLAHRYLALGRRVVRTRQQDMSPGAATEAAYRTLDHLIGRRIRRQLGLQEARVLVSGAAPIDPDLLVWLHALGLPVAEVYGQTEDCGPATLNPAQRIRIGTVGPPLPGVGLRIAPDQEILVDGPTVCAGYFRDPQATRALFDDEGWMHTGDLGTIDADGYLTVIGRKSDLIITAQGKNVSPQEIEVRLRSCPLISEAVVIGDRRPYLVALLTLDADAVAAWARAHGIAASGGAVNAHPALLSDVARAVYEVNRGLSRPEQIKRWQVLPGEFTQVDGELTPTMKVKRNLVIEQHRAIIARMYADDGPTAGEPCDSSSRPAT